MANNDKIKFSFQANPVKWKAITEIAKTEGRNIDAILDDALTHYLESKKNMHSRDFVMDAYRSSYDKYSDLYELLSK